MSTLRGNARSSLEQVSNKSRKISKDALLPPRVASVNKATIRFNPPSYYMHSIDWRGLRALWRFHAQRDQRKILQKLKLLLRALSQTGYLHYRVALSYFSLRRKVRVRSSRTRPPSWNGLLCYLSQPKTR